VTAYIVQADLEERFGVDAIVVASDRNGTGAVDTSIITNAIIDATAEIDSYLTQRYDLPLVTVPTILSRLCCDIAYYRMSSDIGTLTDEKRRRYDDAIKWLTAVAKETIGLGLENDDAVSLDVPQVSSDNEERQFSRTKLDGLI